MVPTPAVGLCSGTAMFLLSMIRGKEWLQQNQDGAGHGGHAGVDWDATIKLAWQGESRAVQFRPDGGQFDFVWLSARTPHRAYVW